jgi:hypothetical protein
MHCERRVIFLPDLPHNDRAAKSTVHRFDYRHRKMTPLTFFPNETEQSGLPIGKRTLSVFQSAQRKGW